MAVARNVVVTLGVTVVLIGALLFLFPQGAQAATIENVATGPLVEDGANGDFKLQATIVIPKGQHIPVPTWARVLVADKTAGFAGGSFGDELSPVECTAVTGGNPSAQVLSVQSASPAVNAPFSGFGYQIDGDSTFGYGYNYGYGQSLGAPLNDFDSYAGGQGYGYGYGTAGIVLQVLIQVHDCPLAAFGFADTGSPAAGPCSDTFLAQAFVGNDATFAIPSHVANVVFANPNPAAACATQLVADGSGVNIIGGPLTRTTFGSPVDFPAGGQIASIDVRSTGPPGVPAGSKVVVSTNNDPSSSAPSFGVLPGVMQSLFPLGDPAIQFQIQLFDPAGNEVDLSTSPPIAVRLVLEIPESYFGTNNPGFFRVFGFEDNGGLKSIHPATVFQGCAGGTCSYQVTITTFSSYAGGATGAIGGGGGGGGGGGTTIITDTETVTPITQTTTTQTDTVIVTETVTGEGGGGSSRTPGFGILAGVAAIAAAFLVRRRL